MPCFEEQESQIIDPLHDIVSFVPSSPCSDHAAIFKDNEIGQQQHGDDATEEQQSYEPEIASVVGETQYISLEIDTQAQSDNDLTSPMDGRLLEDDSSRNVATKAPAAGVGNGYFFPGIVRAALDPVEHAADGFKFSKPKPSILQYARPVPKSFGNNPDPKSPATSDLTPIEPLIVKPQIDPAKSKPESKSTVCQENNFPRAPPYNKSGRTDDSTSASRGAPGQVSKEAHAREHPIQKTHPNPVIPQVPLHAVSASQVNSREGHNASSKDRNQQIKGIIGEPLINLVQIRDIQQPRELVQQAAFPVVPRGAKPQNIPFPEVRDKTTRRRSKLVKNTIGNAASRESAATASDGRRRQPIQIHSGNYPENLQGLQNCAVAQNNAYRSVHENSDTQLPRCDSPSNMGQSISYFRHAVPPVQPPQPANNVGNDQHHHLLNVAEAFQDQSETPDHRSVSGACTVQHNLFAANMEEHSRKGNFSGELSSDDAHGAHSHEQIELFDTPQDFPIRSLATSRSQSRAQSEVQSRPQSRRSNYDMTRPIREEAMQSQGLAGLNTLHKSHATKVSKPNTGRSQVSHPKSNSVATPEQHQYSNHPANMMTKYRDFMSIGQDLEKMIKDSELQKLQVLSQQYEIEKLQDLDVKSRERVKKLEIEKHRLIEKINKYQKLSSKYRNHMNEVVKSQKYLKAQSIAMKEEMEMAVMEVNAKRLADLEHTNSLIDAAAKAAENSADKRRAEQEKLVKNIKGNLEAELRTSLESKKLLNKSNELLKEDLNKNLLELGREKYDKDEFQKQLELEKLNSAHLQKQLEVKTTIHEEFSEILKQIPSGVIDGLNKYEGVLAKLSTLENTTNTTADRFNTLIATLKNNESEPPPDLTNLIEDLFTRLENTLHNLKKDDTQALTVKLLEDLKDNFNQVCLDHEAQNDLNNRIAGLREANATLAAEKIARELVVQGIAQKAEEFKRDLAESRGQLTAKSEELAAILALPKEDPQMQAKIQAMEIANGVLQGHLDVAYQETSKVKAGLSSSQETTRCKDEQIKDLQCKLTDALSRIKSFSEDKKKYQEVCKIEAEKSRQELAKSANASKATITLKHESQVKNLEQKCTKAEAELNTTKEELKMIRVEMAASSIEVNKLCVELARLEDHIKQQDPLLERLEQENPGHASFERHALGLQYVQSEIIAVRDILQSLRNQNTLNEEASNKDRSHRKEIASKIRTADSLEQEKIKLEKKSDNLQKKLDTQAEAFKKQQLIADGQPSSYGTKSSAFGIAGPMAPPRILAQQNALRSVLSSAHSNNMSLPTLKSYHAAKSSSNEDLVTASRESLEYNHAEANQTQRSTSVTSPVLQIVQAHTPNITTTGAPISTITYSTPSSKPQSEHKGSVPRPLRTAQRKSSNLAHSTPLEKNDCFSAHKDAHKDTAQRSSKYSNTKVSHLPKNNSTELTPFYDMPSIRLESSTSMSSLSDIGHMFEDVDEMDTRYKPQGGVEDSNGQQHNNKRTLNVATKHEEAEPAQQTNPIFRRREVPESDQCSDDEPPCEKVKAKTNTLSKIEESNRRRASQPLKSAMKKPQLTHQSSIAETEVYTPKEAPMVAKKKPPPVPVVSNLLRIKGMGSKHQPQPKNEIVSSIKGVRSGSSRGTRSSVPNKRIQDVPQLHAHSDQSQEPKDQRSPIIPHPRRGSTNKRPAPFTPEPSRPAKAPRFSNTGRRPSRSVIPESQGVHN